MKYNWITKLGEVNYNYKIMKKEFLNPKDWAEIMWAYSHWIEVDVWDSKLIFVTWQIAQDSSWNVISEDIEKQTEYVFEIINTILKEANSSLDDVVKVQIFLTDMNDFAKVSPIRNKYLANSKPASTLVEVNKLVKEWCKIEIEVIAIKNKDWVEQ